MYDIQKRIIPLMYRINLNRLRRGKIENMNPNDNCDYLLLLSSIAESKYSTPNKYPFNPKPIMLPAALPET